MTTIAHNLVDQMVQAGEWPEPELLERILEQGEEAVEPLREVLRRDLRGWPDEAALAFAIGLLSDLSAEAAIPDLVNVLRRDYDELLDGVPDELARFGPAIVVPLLDIVRDRSLDWYPRAVAIEAALAAAGSDAVLRGVIAESLRGALSTYIEQAGLAPDDDLPTFLVSGIADLADPLARDLINAAFARDLVDRSFADQASVEASYARGGRFHNMPKDRSIDEYKRGYEAEFQKAREQGGAGEEVQDHGEPAKPAVSLHDPDLPVPTEPVRRQAFRPGRNDPCWCGSGKKYKKCHLIADEASDR